MSAENTRAPSFASSAASGRPTTSDLCGRVSHRAHLYSEHSKPVNDSDGFAVSSVAVREEGVIHSGVFQTLYDSKRRARKNRFDESQRSLVIHYGWRWLTGCHRGE